MGQLRPVSIPDMVSNMAGRNPIRVLADFDRHYMPHDDQPMHASARGNADEHRTALKRKAEGISFEFHGFRFESLDLPLLPADRSDFDVHGALEDDKVPHLA
jgi:hypothetical protein